MVPYVYNFSDSSGLKARLVGHVTANTALSHSTPSPCQTPASGCQDRCAWPSTLPSQGLGPLPFYSFVFLGGSCHFQQNKNEKSRTSGLGVWWNISMSERVAGWSGLRCPNSCHSHHGRVLGEPFELNTVLEVDPLELFEPSVHMHCRQPPPS